MEFQFEIYRKEEKTLIYVSTEGASGAEYEITQKSDIGRIINHYIENYYPDILNEI